MKPNTNDPFDYVLQYIISDFLDKCIIFPYVIEGSHKLRARKLVDSLNEVLDYLNCKNSSETEPKLFIKNYNPGPDTCECSGTCICMYEGMFVIDKIVEPRVEIDKSNVISPSEISKISKNFDC